MIAEEQPAQFEDISELIYWVNQLLKDLRSGALLVQLLDVVYDGKVDLTIVSWEDLRNVNPANFQVMQTAFQTLQIQKSVEFEKLLSGDDTTLYKTLKWIKLYSGTNRTLGEGYDPLARRGGVQISGEGNTKNGAGGVEGVSGENGASKVAGETVGESSIPKPIVGLDFDAKTIQKLAQFDLMKSERDFYFSKLRDVDHFLDVYKDASVDSMIQAIKEILYLPPEKISMVTEGGKVVIKGKEDDQFDQKENINANFLNDEGEDGGGNVGFNFGGGQEGDGEMGDLDLMTEQPLVD